MTGWKVGQPQGIDEEIARWTLDRPPQLVELRAALRRALATQTVPPTIDAQDLADRLMIVATELAGNALRHGLPPTVVALLRADGHLIVDVVDHDPLTAPALDDTRALGAGGLGMQMAERLSQEVGWFQAGDTKHVWAQFVISTN
jgi:serine/threonine-protein kinase RsbW